MDGRPPPASDTVVGVFDRERLSTALIATHRAGFGPHARVLDGARGDLSGQLRRAGIRLSLTPDREEATALIVVTAPGRAASAADILRQAGSRTVHLITRGAPVQASVTNADTATSRTGASTPVLEDEAGA